MTTRPGYIWSGSEWVAVGSPVAPIKYQTSAPTSPSTGDIWVDSDDDVPGIDTSQFLRWRKTAAGSETSVSGTDDTGLTLQYTPNYEQVYLNGVLLVRGQDYTATTGTSITGLTALAASDVVEVFGVVARVVGDVYTQAQADAKYSLKTVTGMDLITSATIGSAVASVNVTNAFSSTYDSYLIVVSGGVASATVDLQLKLGSSTTGYYASLVYGRWDSATVTDVATSNGSAFLYAGHGTTNGLGAAITLINPGTAKYTDTYSTWIGTTASGPHTGVHQVATAYTDFTITPNTGTMTGGTIKVYGYK